MPRGWQRKERRIGHKIAHMYLVSLINLSNKHEGAETEGYFSSNAHNIQSLKWTMLITTH